MPTSAPLLALVLGVAPPPQSPTFPRVEPVVGISTKLMYRSYTLDSEGSRDRDYRLLTKPFGLVAGVQWYWREGGGFHTGGLRSRATLGAELMLPTGGFPMSLGIETGYEWKLRRRVSLFLGGQVTVALDLPSVAYSHGEVGIPLGVSTRRVDIVWSPAMSFPLQRDQQTVFGATTYRNVAVMVMPLHFSLVFKLGSNRVRSRATPALND